MNNEPVVDKEALTEMAGARELALMPAPTLKNAVDYGHAADVLKDIKGRIKRLEAKRTELKRPILEAGRRLDEWFKIPIGHLTEAEANVKGAMLSYRQAEEARAKALQKAADEAAAKERARLAALAEAERMQAAIDAAWASGAVGGEEKAAAIEERGAVSAANLEAEINRVRSPLVKPEVPQVAGQYTRKVWKYEITDFAALPDRFKLPNTALINAVAGTDVPGVRYWQEEIIVSQGRG